MIINFDRDLEIGKRAEQIVYNTFSSLAIGYKFYDVSNIQQYRYKGDILAIADDGRQIFIEVKNDSRIADTGNILCEEEVFMKDGGYYTKGNMHCDSDIYCVVSEQEHKIYILDFKKLKAHYKKGEFKQIEHPQQFSICYLLPIGVAKQHKAIIDVIEF